MPYHVDLPVRRLDSSGSSNALLRFGRISSSGCRASPGSPTIAKETRWLPVLGPSLPVEVPEVVAVIEPNCDYPERWSVVRGSTVNTLRRSRQGGSGVFNGSGTAMKPSARGSRELNRRG
jgi:hypothetical protein